MHLLLELQGLNGIIVIMLAIMLGPAILLAFIGFMVRKNNKKAANILFILAVLYVLVSFGICGSLLT
ncbi:hypothetical protein [Aestuariibaculum sediminum]|uniref:Uncharacterized protein n=1 Tax=Aestuariibaculum sediminum TaxID=2770637 RepID=A0A8J6UF93_9FLAO|nr:hypothetical protein [Aestuariibaculum sediminum]MBD0831286.1 hypothetical protein [Aestuariibaculum sediminum]